MDKVEKIKAEIERIMSEQQEKCKADVAHGKDPDSKNIEVIYQFQQLIKFIDTLEVKEVDLEEEYKDFVEEDPVYNKLVNDIVGKAIAKHFYELGLKTQKGE